MNPCKSFAISTFLMLMLATNLAIGATYTYTGSVFTSASGAYTTSMRISGSFTTNAPLAANLPGTEIGPSGADLVTSWSFTDGVNTFNEVNSMELYGDSAFFSVATDSNGQITSFSIGLMSPLMPHTVGQPMDAIAFSGLQQAASDEPCATVANDVCTSIPTGGTNFADSDNGGTWEISPAEAEPVPALPFWGLGVLAALLGFFGAGRRMK